EPQHRAGHRLHHRSEAHADHDRQGAARPRRVRPHARVSRAVRTGRDAGTARERSARARVRRIRDAARAARALHAQGDTRGAGRDPAAAGRVRRRQAMSPVTVNWTALTHVIGWTLVHFVWQGILLAAALGLIRLLIPQPFVRVRYAAGCITLAAMLAVPLLTATQIAGGWANAPAPSVATTDAEHLASVRSNVSAVVERTAVPFGSPARDRVLPLLVIAWGIGVLV